MNHIVNLQLTDYLPPIYVCDIIEKELDNRVYAVFPKGCSPLILCEVPGCLARSFSVDIITLALDNRLCCDPAFCFLGGGT